VVGFTGSRALSATWSALVGRVVTAVLASERGIAVGCANGADLFVRQAAPGAEVFSVASGRWGAGRAAFAARSAAMVRAVAASGPGAGFVGFVSVACQAGIRPARSWRAGSPPSGSWSTLALAAGLGLPVVVFWCGPGQAQLPAWSGGSWSPAAPAGVWAAGWGWGAGQPPLL
jgi:hypothetical protein